MTRPCYSYSRGIFLRIMSDVQTGQHYKVEVEASPLEIVKNLRECIRRLLKISSSFPFFRNGQSNAPT